MRNPKRSSRAFSLIELAMVAACVALLAAVLLPVLDHLKRQARTQVCVSNMRQIAMAANVYLVEYPDLSWTIPGTYSAGGATYSSSFITEFVWGGGMPDKTASDWQNSGLAAAMDLPAGTAIQTDTYRIPPRLRPLNRFIAADVHWDNEPSRRVNHPKPLPAVFKCPMDTTPWIPTIYANNPIPAPDDRLPSWDWWGNSYAANWYWPYYYIESEGGNFLTLLGATSGTEGYGKRLLKEKTGRTASELVIFYENYMNLALQGARPPGWSGSGPGPWRTPPVRAVGWHGEFSKHVAAFRDGSARYRYYDTRTLMGCDWTLWPDRPWVSPWMRYNDDDPPCP